MGSRVPFPGVRVAFGHRSLRVYGLALEIAVRVFRATRTAPAFAWPVTRQLVKAMTSVVLNIAEGAGEFTPREKARFYRMSRRSACEVVAAVDLLVAMNVMPEAVAREADADLDEMCSVLTAMIRNQDTRADQKPQRKDTIGASAKEKRRPRTTRGPNPSPSPSPSP